jgi:hypothetical protein
MVLPSEKFSEANACTVNCVLAVVEVSMVYFAVEDEPAPGHSLGHAPRQRAEVRSIVLI